MSKRTQQQVDALWPKGRDQYTFVGHVTLPATVKTKAEAATAIQPLYEGIEAAAGMFDVKKRVEQTAKKSVFEVTFLRDVPDDTDVVNAELLKGGKFDTVLRKQLQTELANAIAEGNRPIKVKLVSGPKFSKIRL